MQLNSFLKIALFSISSLTAFSVFANDADHITIKMPYAREVPPMAQTTASFMTLKNNSNEAIFLVNATSPVANLVQLHEHIHDQGVMRMRRVDTIRIPAHGEAKLQPGGFHIMLIHLKHKIKRGDQVQETLIFQDGSYKTIKMPVKSVMGMKMGNMQH